MNKKSCFHTGLLTFVLFLPAWATGTVPSDPNTLLHDAPVWHREHPFCDERGLESCRLRCANAFAEIGLFWQTQQKRWEQAGLQNSDLGRFIMSAAAESSAIAKKAISACSRERFEDNISGHKRMMEFIGGHVKESDKTSIRLFKQKAEFDALRLFISKYWPPYLIHSTMIYALQYDLLQSRKLTDEFKQALEESTEKLRNIGAD